MKLPISINALNDQRNALHKLLVTLHPDQAERQDVLAAIGSLRMLAEFVEGSSMASWAETCCEIAMQMMGDDMEPLREHITDAGGRVAMHSHAQQWADEFQERYKDQFWDGEFYEYVDAFLKEKQLLMLKNT